MWAQNLGIRNWQSHCQRAIQQVWVLCKHMPQLRAICRRLQGQGSQNRESVFMGMIMLLQHICGPEFALGCWRHFVLLTFLGLWVWGGWQIRTLCASSRSASALLWIRNSDLSILTRTYFTFELIAIKKIYCRMHIISEQFCNRKIWGLRSLWTLRRIVFRGGRVWVY